jgi:hypothetical protein
MRQCGTSIKEAMSNIAHRRANLGGLFHSMSDGWVDLCRVQCIQAIERMLNARRWARLFFREQNPKPISYFRTDCGVVV